MEIRDEYLRRICNDLIHGVYKRYPSVSRDFLVACFSDSSICHELDRLSSAVISVVRSALLKTGIKEITQDLIDDVNDFIQQKYPVYVRWQKRAVSKTCDSIGRVYDALRGDEEILKAEFGIKEPLCPSTVQFNLGDAHRGGKGVVLLEYPDGRKVVYKPRNLSIDVHFARLLAYIQERSGISFVAPKTIVREDHGWVEFVEYQECGSAEEIGDYYFRIGGLLALLYSLNATDFHYENIICKGSFPVLIDLESFFVPYFPIESAETSLMILESVLGTGLLPTTVVVNKEEEDADRDKEALEICGLVDVEGQEAITDSLSIAVDDNGEITVSRERGRLIGAKNIPAFGSQKVHPEDYAAEITRGFEKVYSIIAGDKTGFVSQLESFKDDAVRIIFRDTAAYAHLLHEANNVNILCDEDSLRSLFSRWLYEVVPDYRFLENIVEHEIDDLVDHDIPLFTTTVSSCNLWYKDDECIEDCFLETGYDRVLRKIDKMGAADCERQKWLIEASLNYKTHLSEYGNKGESVLPKNVAGQIGLDGALSAVASDIRDFIINHIQETEESVCWLAVNAGNYSNTRVQIFEASYDLFTGMPGEILFLANYGRLFNDPRSTHLARKAYLTLRETTEKTKDSIKQLGLYKGWGSIIFLNTSLFVVTGDREYLQQNRTYFEEIDFQPLIDNDNNYGVIKGCAGFILACVDYYKVSKDDKALEAAMAAADYLLENRSPGVQPGIGWRIVSKAPLSGFSHGASGFALAFLRLYEQTREKKYFDAIPAIVEYEDSTYDEGKKNWKDLRDHVIRAEGEEPFLAAWSHGAGGIGLVRLEMMKSGLFDSASVVKRDLDNALETIISKGFSDNLSLTVGSFGNMELLHNYLEAYDNDRVREKKLLFLNNICKAYLSGEYCVCYPIKALGLMAGLTGIGYECLRLLRPDLVRSVLVV
ncbi:MAG: type 2 lantipeptide synthetase LanM [Bacteroidales bacterium]|nr:type 2 lantipeptide synthetase LanM [Bacteroidales bacterium]